MTYPIPDPPQLPPGSPRIYSVPLKSCCQQLEGDECDCLAELVEALTAPCIGPVVAYDREMQEWAVTR